MGDLSGLLAAMPAAHTRVLASLELVVEAEGVTDHENPQVRRLVVWRCNLRRVVTRVERACFQRLKQKNDQLEMAEGVG